MANPKKAVQAVYVRTEAQDLAYKAADAVGSIQVQLGALRAVESLARNELAASEEYLPQLKRDDLAVLLSVLTSNLDAHCTLARAAALACAKGVAP